MKPFGLYAAARRRRGWPPDMPARDRDTDVNREITRRDNPDRSTLRAITAM